MAKTSTFWERQSKARAQANGKPDVGGLLPDLVETMPNVREFLIGGQVDGKWVKGGTVAFAVDDRGASLRCQDRTNGLVVWIALAEAVAFDEFAVSSSPVIVRW